MLLLVIYSSVKFRVVNKNEIYGYKNSNFIMILVFVLLEYRF